METNEIPSVESTLAEASSNFLNRFSQRLSEQPVMRTMSRVLSGTKSTAALTGIFGLMSAGQATEGGASGVIGATMFGLLSAEMAGATVINAVRNRKANKQQKPQ